jgi:hypothetical protein
MKILEILRDKMNKTPIQAWKSFSTAKHTITEADIYEEVTVPSNAAEVILSSDSEFTIGESNTATGYKTDEIKLGIASMEKIYLKGALDQEIKITWGLL